MSTHNIRFYGELTKIILQLSSNTLLICSSGQSESQRQTIRISNGCEGTENSVTRVTIWNHEACRVMLNCYLEWRHFQFAPNKHYGFFFLQILPSTNPLKLKHALFHSFYAKITTFLFKKCSVRIFSMTLISKHLVENDIKTKQKKMHAWESSDTPWWKTTFPYTGQLHGNSCRVCRKELNFFITKEIQFQILLVWIVLIKWFGWWHVKILLTNLEICMHVL